MGDCTPFGFRPTTVPLWPSWQPTYGTGFDQILPSSAPFFGLEALGVHRSTALRLRGLPAETTEQDIFAFFSKHDVVAQIEEQSGAVQVFTGTDGKFNGEAVVYMQSWESAEEARKTLHGQLLGTSEIKVAYDTLPGLGYSPPVQALAGYPAFINASSPEYVHLGASAAEMRERSDALVQENPQCPTAALAGEAEDNDYRALWNFLTDREPESLPTGMACGWRGGDLTTG